MIAGVVEGDLCWEAMAVAHVGTCAAQDVQMPLRARVEGGGVRSSCVSMAPEASEGAAAVAIRLPGARWGGNWRVYVQ